MYFTQYGPCMVTGGAGFIGSHLVDKLISLDLPVTALDNFSSGSMINLKKSKKEKKFQLIKQDLRNSDHKSLRNIKTVFHFAAYPEVRTGYEKPELAFRENIENTYKFLESIRRSNVQNVVFSSSSVVYGEPRLIPTPERYAPLFPISPYGGSKLACEGLISSYCHNYGIRGIILRFANVIGGRSRHGVIWDFINKLQKNSTRLEILGNGKQTKSYIHVSDCLDGTLISLKKSKNKVDVYNIGNVDKINVIKIAKIVSNNMGFTKTKLITQGGTKDGRGWIGDVTLMLLDIEKLSKLGWKPKLSSSDSVNQASVELLSELSVK